MADAAIVAFFSVNSIKIKLRRIKACKKKNPSFVSGMDRQICLSVCDPWDRFVYPCLTRMMDSYIFLYTPVNFLKLTSSSLLLSLKVDTWLIIFLYGSTHGNVHFYWLNTEMIGILRQLKSTSTETGISQTGTQRDMLV